MDQDSTLHGDRLSATETRQLSLLVSELLNRMKQMQARRRTEGNYIQILPGLHKELLRSLVALSSEDEDNSCA